MQRFDNAKEAALALRPDEPVYCFRPEVLKATRGSSWRCFRARLPMRSRPMASSSC